MNVVNMTGRTGRAVANQFIIIDSEGRKWFQSYNTMIAVIGLNRAISLDRTSWDYSTTTGKYRNKFLGETRRETEKKIKSGEYILTDLN